MSDTKKTYLAIHKPTGAVFGSFTHEIHAILFLGSFHHIKIDDFMEIRAIPYQEPPAPQPPQRFGDGTKEGTGE